MTIVATLLSALEWLINWPLMLYVTGAGILCTLAFGGIQFRSFFYAWRLTLFPEKSATTSSGEVTPFQAFINTLSTNLGNGSIAGMATAIYAGGPGAAFWVIFFGFVLMAVRFAEVYLSVYFGARVPAGSKRTLGGPMLYLEELPGNFGKSLAFVYAFFCFFFGLVMGNATQANSIALSITSTFCVNPLFVTVGIFMLIMYVVLGGAKRVSALTAGLVPVNVVVFFVTTFAVLGYHYQALIPSLTLIVKSAFSPVSLTGGVIGFTVSQAIRFGMARSILATESGLGTAAILYGFTGSKEAMKNGITSMLSTFISTFVCFIVALCIVTSGVWNCGLNSTALTATAFKTVFGQFGCIAVTFLSISFGLGVMVAYAYVTRAAWLFLTGGRFAAVHMVAYCACAALGTLVPVDHMWATADVVNAFMLFINLFGVVLLIPIARAGIARMHAGKLD